MLTLVIEFFKMFLDNCKTHPPLLFVVAAVGIGSFWGYSKVHAENMDTTESISKIQIQLNDQGFKIDSLQKDTKSLKVAALRAQIMEARKGQCRASNPEAKAYYQSTLDGLESDYYNLNGYQYNLPECAVFQ